MVNFPLIVIGAGPAGLAAAAEASRLGLRTLLLDERPQPGGSVAGPLPGDFDGQAPWLVPPVMYPQRRSYVEELIQQCYRAQVEIAAGALVWSVSRGSPRRVTVRLAGGSYDFSADRIIFATGTYVVPAPPYGINHPAVLTPPEFYARVLDGSIGRGQVAIAGNNSLAQFLFQFAIENGLACRFSNTFPPGDWEPGDGNMVVAATPISSAIELPYLAGCEVEFNGFHAGFRPLVNDDFRCSALDLYAVGGLAGISDPVAAALSGQVAALDVAAWWHGPSQQLTRRQEELRHNLRRRMEKVQGSDGAGAGLSWAENDSGLVLCPCTGLTVAELRQAVALGPRTFNDLKRVSGAGTGPCQARCCLRAVISLLPDGTMPMKVRPPVRPVPLADLLPGSEEEVLAGGG